MRHKEEFPFSLPRRYLKPDIHFYGRGSRQFHNIKDLFKMPWHNGYVLLGNWISTYIISKNVNLKTFSDGISRLHHITSGLVAIQNTSRNSGKWSAEEKQVAGCVFHVHFIWAIYWN